MGIKFYCPQGHKLHVKAFLGGKRGICPHCGSKVRIPAEDPGLLDESSLNAFQNDPAAGATTEAAFAQYQVPNTQGSREDPHPTDQHANADTPTHPTKAQIENSSEPALDIPSKPQGEHAGSTIDPHIDLLDEIPHAEWYVRPQTGGEFGPASNDVMRDWLSQGRVGPDSMVWRKDWDSWVQARGVFPDLSMPEDHLTPAGLPRISEKETNVETINPAPDSTTSANKKMASNVESNPITARQRRKTSLSLLIVIILAVGILVLIPVLFFVLSNK